MRSYMLLHTCVTHCLGNLWTKRAWLSSCASFELMLLLGHHGLGLSSFIGESFGRGVWDALLGPSTRWFWHGGHDGQGWETPFASGISVLLVNLQKKQRGIAFYLKKEWMSLMVSSGPKPKKHRLPFQTLPKACVHCGSGRCIASGQLGT